jgi:transposase InsO family protein
VSVRTLWNWEHEPEERRAPGRPRDEEARKLARILVRQELDRQGWECGEGPIFRAFGGQVKLHLVREMVAELKRERRSEVSRVRGRERVSVRVHARDVLWSLDQTHVGRTPDGRAVQGELLRDVASGLVLDLSVGPSIRAPEVVAMLERARVQRGTLPLALAGDLGPENENGEVELYLAMHGVVRLRSLPRTPQHNAWIERTIGDYKGATGLGKGVFLRGPDEALERLAQARERLDRVRLRPTLGWRTAADYDASLPSALVNRWAFYAAAHAAQERAMLGAQTDRERRSAERRATLATLVCNQLITMYRGGAPTRVTKPEVIP